MIRAKKASTVANLIKQLSTLPKDATWYGFHDESIIVEHPQDPTRYWIIDPNEDVAPGEH